VRPYLAILKDSFREAIASRTLPFLLVFFTLALLVLAPIGLHQDVAWRLTFEEVSDQTLWLAKLRHQSQEEGDNPGKRLLERLPPNVKTQLGLTGEPATSGGADRTLVLTLSINDKVLPDATFYSEEAWEDLPLSKEARDLIGRGPEQLSDAEVKRLNRLLLSAAYPASLKTPTESRATITYFGWEIPGFSGGLEQFISETEMVRRIVRQLIYIACIWGIGPIGLLVAIIVTADIMPRTYEPGAIDLLLSKPVSRSLVFLTKFLGACAFVLISFTYLVVGLWLIFWLRLDVWTPQLLGAIPLFLFSFAVIYSISAVTGLRWRSPIVSVLTTVLVWGAAFLLGMSRDVMKELRADERVRQITPAGDALIVSDFERTAYVWSGNASDWQEESGLVPPVSGVAAGNPLLRPKVLGPLYDPTHERIVVAEAGAIGDNILRFASAKTNWRSSEGAKLPPGTADVFVTRDGRLFAAGRAGLFEFRGDPTIKKKEFMIFGMFDLVPEDAQNVFVRVDPAGGWSESVSADLDEAGETAVIYDGGTVHLLRREEDGRFENAAKREIFEQKNPPPGLVAIANGLVAIAVKDGTIRLLDTRNLADVATLQPFGDEIPRSAAISPDGAQLAVLFHSGDVWLYDAKARKAIDAAPAGQGDVTAVAFDETGRLYTADRLRRVTRSTVPELRVEERFVGSLPTSEKVYRYALTPLSYILPDTYGLRSVYQYLFTDLKSESTTADETDLESRRIRYELRRPLLQNIAFLAVVLGAACLYATRKDF